MPDLIYNVKFQIDDSQFQQESAGVERYKQEIEEANAEIAELKAQLGSAANESKKFSRTGKTIETSTKRMNSSFSSANQALFSFSDLTQDAAQFQQGFGTGMRAIGNNVGFTAELLGSLNARVRQHNAALRAQVQAGTMSEAVMRSQATTMRSQLVSSLIGPGGLLIGINLVVTAITIFTQRMDKNRRAARDAAETNSHFNSIIEKQVRRLQDARAEMDKMFDRDSISARTQALTVERNRNQVMLKFLKEQRDLNKENLDVAQQTVNKRQSDTFIEALAAEERKQQLKDAEAELPFLENRQAVLDNEIKSLEERNKKISNGFFLLNLEEQAMRNMNELSEEGNQIRGEGGQFLVPVSDPLMIEDSIKASKELEMFRAEQLVNEFDRAERVKQLRIQDAEDRRFALEISETRERLLKEQAEQDYQDTINDLRDESAKREAERQEALLELQQNINERRIAIEKRLADTTISVNQQMIQSIQSSLGSLLGQTKVSAIAMLAIEKGLAIGRLMADATAKSTALKNEATKLVFEAGPKLLSPLTAAQGAMELKQAGAMIGGAGTIMSTAKKNAGKIAALGLGQIIGVAAAGTGGGGATGGGSSSSSASQFGMQTVEGDQRFRTPQYQPRRTEDSMGAQTNVQIMADRKQLYALVNKGQQEYNGIKTRTTATS